MGVRFSNKMVAELYQPFWAALQAGEFLTDAAAFAGTHRWRRLKWLREAGGVRPRRGRDPQGRYLSFAEREEIALGRAAGESVRSIAARLGRSPSTVSRELARTAQGGKAGYRATSAHALTYVRASQPIPAKLATNVVLRKRVEQDLSKRYSPEQIAGRLRQQYPDHRRCGCRPRRSTSRCTCSPGASRQVALSPPGKDGGGDVLLPGRGRGDSLAPAPRCDHRPPEAGAGRGTVPACRRPGSAARRGAER